MPTNASYRQSRSIACFSVFLHSKTLQVFLFLSIGLSNIATVDATPILQPARALAANEKLADSGIFQLISPWSHIGDLDNLEGPSHSFTRTFRFPALPTDNFRNVTGSRNHLHPTSTAYEQQFSGRYEDAPILDAWQATPDLFTAAGGNITATWGTVPGWKTPTGVKETFNQDWNLIKQRLSPGELGCPSSFAGRVVIGCPVVETWWGGALDVKASGSATASIDNSFLGTELSEVILQLDRLVDYKVDSTSRRIASLLSGNLELKLLEDSGLDDINIEFDVKMNNEDVDINVSGDTVWRRGGTEIESANPSYQLNVAMDKYLIEGVRDLYKESLLDFPSMALGIIMSNGTGANASAFMGAFNPDSAREAVIRIETVDEPNAILLITTALLLLFGVRFRSKNKI